MSFRIHCPECDTVFEPPDEVWSARCPFCEREVEVPRNQANTRRNRVRGRYRKRPGWLVWIQAHLPGWANGVLVVSFCMLLFSALVEALIASTGHRAMNNMQRAIVNWEKVREVSDPTKRLQALENLLDNWQADSNEVEATKSGLKKSTIEKIKTDTAREVWKKNLSDVLKLSPDLIFPKLKLLVEDSERKKDLQGLALEGRSTWDKVKSEHFEQLVSQVQIELEDGQAEKLGNKLTQLEEWVSKTLPGENTVAEQVKQLEHLAMVSAKKRGVVLRFLVNRQNFTEPSEIIRKTQPLLESNLKSRGYLVNPFKSRKLADSYQEDSSYQLNSTISESFGRVFEDTPHRTTQIEIRLMLLRAGKEIASSTATARTTKIPARTSLGMSRLQLSKQSDEKIERKLNESAWESLPVPLRQAIYQFPTAIQN